MELDHDEFHTTEHALYFDDLHHSYEFQFQQRPRGRLRPGMGMNPGFVPGGYPTPYGDTGIPILPNLFFSTNS